MGQMVPLSLEIPVRACTSSVIPVLITTSLIHHHNHTKICLCLCVCRLHTDYKGLKMPGVLRSLWSRQIEMGLGSVLIQWRIQTKLKSRSCRSRAKSSRRGESKDGPDEGAGGPTGSGCRSTWVRRMAGGQQLARLRQQCRTSWGGPGVVRHVLPGSFWHTLAGERTGQGAITQLVFPLLWVRVRELNPSSLWPFPWMVCPVRFGACFLKAAMCAYGPSSPQWVYSVAPCLLQQSHSGLCCMGSCG